MRVTNQDFLLFGLGEDERPDQAESPTWESLNLLQDEVSHGQEEMEVAREGLEKILGLAEKDNMSLTGENLEKLAKAHNESMKVVSSRVTLVMEVKVAKLAKEDQDPVSACEASVRTRLNG